MNKRILLIAIIIAIFLSAGLYFWLRKVSAPVLPSSKITPPATTKPITNVKNVAIPNPQNDLVGSNFFEGVGLVWNRDDRAVEYVLFRSNSIDSPFTELDRIRTGIDIRTNYTDFTSDALIKTLCYKLEAHDASGKRIRVYEPICVPPYVGELPKIKNPTINNTKVDFLGTNFGNSIVFNWSPADYVKEYVRFRAYSINEPWEEEGRIPGSLTNGVDITPEARERTLCYRLEARDTQGSVVRNYEAICIPKYEPEN